MNWWKVVMLGENKKYIMIDDELSLEEANELLYECKKDDIIHDYEIQVDKAHPYKEYEYCDETNYEQEWLSERLDRFENNVNEGRY